MNNPESYLNYRELDEEQKDFAQRLVFLDYIEDAEERRFKWKRIIKVNDILNTDKEEFRITQEYELCMLIYDIQHRFKKEIEDFDTYYDTDNI